MLRYVELAINSQRNIRDVLNQYRTTCQTAHIASMEKVLTQYLDLVHSRMEKAQKTLNDATGASGASDIVDDLEETPESLLQRAAEDTKDEKGSLRTAVTQWVKYVWETYRTILEVTRNNDKVQELYHRTAQKGFLFCAQYKRAQEFRRLCEMLRTHYSTVDKYQQQLGAVDLNSPETQDLYLRTRYAQLKTAADLQLWQEAYRTIEDIGSPPTKSKLMTTYYEKLAQIFWASQNHLFHAYSLNRLFELQSLAPDVDAKELQQLATAVTIATLVVPVQAVEESTFDPENESNLHLARLLGFRKEIPTRQRLMEGIQTSDVLSSCATECQSLTSLLETDFGPLSMKKKLNPILDFLKTQKYFAQYVKPLEQTAILRLLSQLATVFKTMKVDRLVQLLPGDVPMHTVEQIILNSNTTGLTRIRFDHRRQLIHFADEDMSTPKMPAQLATLSTTLSALATKVQHANEEAKLVERRKVFLAVQAGMERDHKEIFTRIQEIYRRKIVLEKQEQAAQEDKVQKARQEKQQRENEERVRLIEQEKRRESERKRIENEKRHASKLKELAQRLEKEVAVQGATLKTTQQINKALENIEHVRPEDLEKLQQKVATEAERRANELRRHTATELDFFTRALRREEKPLILARSEQQIKENKSQMELEYKNYLAAETKRHSDLLADKKILARMDAQVVTFKDITNARRQAKYDEQMAGYNKRKAAWEAEQRQKAEEQRQRDEAAAAERERRRAEEEAARAAQEAERQRREDELAAKRQEEAEQERRRQAAEEKRRIYEAEVDAREKARREAAASSRQGAYRPPARRFNDGPRSGGRFDRDDGPRGGGRFDRDDGPRGGGRFDRDDGPRFGGRYGRDRDDGPRGGGHSFGAREDGGNRFGGNRDGADSSGGWRTRQAESQSRPQTRTETSQKYVAPKRSEAPDNDGFTAVKGRRR
jgi:translation initiation factor 3 subunit A